MLRVDLADLRVGPVEIDGELAADDPVLARAEPGLAVVAPVRVAGRLATAGEGKYYWRARLGTTVRVDCRRCLTPVDVPVSASAGLVFAFEGEATEDDGCYIIPARARVLDLTEAAREELILAFPLFVECRPDCRGLCARCGANLNDGPCGCAPAGDPRWDALRALGQPESKGH